MLISLIGPPASGKTSIAHYLSAKHGFRLLLLTPPSISSSDKVSLADRLTLQRHALLTLPSSWTSPVEVLNDPKEMLDYVTDRWQESFVTLDLVHKSDLDAFSKRPFFLLVDVNAPLLVRHLRYNAKYDAKTPLEVFLATNDEITFGSSDDTQSVEETPTAASMIGADSLVADVSSLTLSSRPGNSSALSQLLKYSNISITNSGLTLDGLQADLTSLNLTSGHRLRPGWDAYFLSLCNLASLRSNCMKRRVGAVLVSANRILATGYNGTPSGLTNCNQGGCPRCNNTLPTDAKEHATDVAQTPTKMQPSASLQRGKSSACGQNLEECLCLHAEENALLEAGRAKIASPSDPGLANGSGGAVLYCNTCPCLRCAVKIIQCGIKKVVYQLEYSMDTRTKTIFAQSSVEIRQFHLD